MLEFINIHSNKYKNQLQNIAEGSRDGNAKKFTNKGSKKYKGRPYILFLKEPTSQSEKKRTGTIIEQTAKVTVM